MLPEIGQYLPHLRCQPSRKTRHDMSPATSISDSNHPDIFQIRCHNGNCQEPVCILSKGSHGYPLCLSHHTICFKRHATCRCFLDPKQVCSNNRPSNSISPTGWSIKSKPEFWAHVYTQLESLIGEERNWAIFLHSRSIPLAHGWYKVTNCANASSLIYNSLLAFPAYFGTASNKAVNWCGMLLRSTPQSGILIALHSKWKH